MSARDDYPTKPDGTVFAFQYEAMCDEIDRLRAAEQEQDRQIYLAMPDPCPPSARRAK